MFKQSRLVDFSLSLVGLVLLLPIALLSYPLLVFLLDRPIIFKQKRLGQKGKVFALYKLRSMQPNAEKIQKKYLAQNEAPWPMFKITDDPRFLKKTINFFGQKKAELAIGKFLSKSGIDELPQLINILRGEMNLIGPRPLPIKEANLLKTIDADWYEWRHRVKPGVFSFWALDKKHNQSLTYWKKLEKKTLKINSLQKIKIVWQIIMQQFQLILRQIKLKNN